jgi:hypothetical protein
MNYSTQLLPFHSVAQKRRKTQSLQLQLQLQASIKRWRECRLPLQSTLILQCSGFLRIVGSLSTGVSVQPVGPIFKGPETSVLNQTTLRNNQEDGRINLLNIIYCIL